MPALLYNTAGTDILSSVIFGIMKYFEHVEEATWAVEVLKGTGLPVAASLAIGPEGDLHGVSTGECAVRLAKAGKWLFNQCVGGWNIC